MLHFCLIKRYAAPIVVDIEHTQGSPDNLRKEIKVIDPILVDFASSPLEISSSPCKNTIFFSFAPCCFVLVPTKFIDIEIIPFDLSNY